MKSCENRRNLASGTTDYAAMLLNIGTAQRVMGQMDRAESNYEEAYAIFKEKLHERIIGWRHYITIEVFCMQIPAVLRKQADLQMAMELIQKLEQSDVKLRLHMQISVISVLHYRNLTKDFSICSRQQKSLNVRKERRIRIMHRHCQGLVKVFFERRAGQKIN